jgi:hypothetical protein
MPIEHKTFKVQGMPCVTGFPDPQNEKPSVSRVAPLLISDTGNPAQCIVVLALLQ